VMWLTDDADTVVGKLGPDPGHSRAEIKPASHSNKSRASQPMYRCRDRQYVC
jgi:hypothetical protein